MVEMTYRNPLLFVSTDKFKDMTLSLKYHYSNTEPEVTYANLLAYLLTDRCQKYSTKQAMSQKMDALYGLSLDTKTSSFGQLHTLEIRVKTLNPRYTQENILKDVVDFLEQCIQFPLINASTFKEAKVNLESALKRIDDHPVYKSFILATQVFKEETPLSVFSQGSLKQLKQTRIKDVISFHQDLLKQQPVIIVSGEPAVFSEMDLSRFILKTVSTTSPTYVFNQQAFGRKKIQRNIQQTTLTQLYRTQVAYGSMNYYAMRIMIIILGQLPNSLLFSEIREKRSLCYSIQASSLNFEGLMSIQTGISFEKLTEVRELIQVQIQRLQAGKISNRLLETAKKLMISSMRSIKDDRPAYLNFIYQRLMTDQSLEVEPVLLGINAVQREDIVRVAQQLELVSEGVVEGQIL